MEYFDFCGPGDGYEGDHILASSEDADDERAQNNDEQEVIPQEGVGTPDPLLHRWNSSYRVKICAGAFPTPVSRE